MKQTTVYEQFESRTLTREAYERCASSYRKVRRNGGFYEPEISESESLRLHFFDVRDAVRDAKLLPEHLQYHAVSDVYAWYMSERISDYGACAYEAELERQASLYHLFGNGSGFVIR